MCRLFVSYENPIQAYFWIKNGRQKLLLYILFLLLTLWEVLSSSIINISMLKFSGIKHSPRGLILTVGALQSSCPFASILHLSGSSRVSWAAHVVRLASRRDKLGLATLSSWIIFLLTERYTLSIWALVLRQPIKLGPTKSLCTRANQP